MSEDQQPYLREAPEAKAPRVGPCLDCGLRTNEDGVILVQIKITHASGDIIWTVEPDDFLILCSMFNEAGKQLIIKLDELAHKGETDGQLS